MEAFSARVVGRVLLDVPLREVAAPGTGAGTADAEVDLDLDRIARERLAQRSLVEVSAHPVLDHLRAVDPGRGPGRLHACVEAFPDRHQHSADVRIGTV